MYRKTATALMLLLMAAAANGQSMLECSALEDEQERLDCYDRVAGRVEKKLEEKRSGTTEERIESRNESITEAVVGEMSQDTAPDILKIRIERVIRDRNRRVIYQTDDGRYFRRSTDTRTTFKVGDVCVIEHGVFDSKFLVREDGKRSKVKELNVD